MIIPAPIDTKNIVTQDDKVACAIKDLLVSKGTEYGLARAAALTMRFLNFVNRKLYWSDLCIHPEDSEQGLHVNLGELIDCGLSISDIKASIPRCSYAQLRHVFRFNPDDLRKNYALFNLSHLVQYFNVGYADLAIDYYLGVYDYFVALNLSLANIARFEITVDVALNWREHFTEAFDARGKPHPQAGNGMNWRVSRAMQPLDRKMLKDRFKARNSLKRQSLLDSPNDWVALLNLTLEHLIEMEVTLEDLNQWWLDPFNLTLDELLNVFPDADEQGYYYKQPLQVKREPAPQHKHSKKKAHKKHAKHYHSSSDPEEEEEEEDDNHEDEPDSDWRDKVPSVWDRF